MPPFSFPNLRNVYRRRAQGIIAPIPFIHKKTLWSVRIGNLSFQEIFIYNFS
ncbi:hypothetical protein LptCag_0739 [Leptospirillum ferriphilum]|uniref:Uncharacterized protein n=2 Tax=Leptospirillum ferriphilum TaxID=178606 RepID=A0A094W9C0_9BACT|nr:hypothetical protein LFML04_2116 [Leptospirillum ferriphilum ML-04]KGA94113.1 hypothetical protein LptCag_0739 [Leptospirillum ferriphilum]